MPTGSHPESHPVIAVCRRKRKAFLWRLRPCRHLLVQLWFAKTSAEAQNGAVLGRVSLNTIIDSIQQEDTGAGEPAFAWSAHI